MTVSRVSVSIFQYHWVSLNIIEYLQCIHSVTFSNICALCAHPLEHQSVSPYHILACIHGHPSPHPRASFPSATGILLLIYGHPSPHPRASFPSSTGHPSPHPHQLNKRLSSFRHLRFHADIPSRPTVYFIGPSLLPWQLNGDIGAQWRPVDCCSL